MGKQLPDDHTMLVQLYTIIIGTDGNGFVKEMREMKKEFHEFVLNREATCPIAKKSASRRTVWFSVITSVAAAVTAAATTAIVSLTRRSQ